jgi:hypothetical protein
MTGNSILETVHDDELADETLDRAFMNRGSRYLTLSNTAS